MSNFREATSPAFQKAPIRSIRYWQRQGCEVSDDATILDCWRSRQVKLRRDLGLPDQAPYEDVVAATIKRTHVDDSLLDELEVPLENLDELAAQECQIGEQLRLVREADHPQNMYAVRVCRQSGGVVGYLPGWLCGDGSGIGTALAEQMDRGRPATAHVLEIRTNHRNKGEKVTLKVCARVWR